MVDKRKLMGRIVAAGHSQSSLAEAIKVSKNTLNAKINGKAVFNTDEVARICDELGITDDREKVLIFLTKSSQNRDETRQVG